MEKRLLITGANGYLGSFIAKAALQVGQPVTLWFHATDDIEFQEKSARLRSDFAPYEDLVDWHYGDLTWSTPFSTLPQHDIGAIVHSAALTQFSISHEAAYKVNVQGSDKLYAYAEQCPNLQRLILISTVYACGLRTGDVPEERFTPSEPFANFYEWSKWRAEEALFDRYPHLPWQILRSSTVMADDDSGKIGQLNAFHNTLRLLFYGLVSVLPGDPSVRLPFITGEQVATAVLQTNTAPRHVCLHIAPAPDECESLERLVDIAMTRFARHPSFVERGVQRPLFCAEPAFKTLQRGMQGLGSQVMQDGLSSMSHFAAQLYRDKTFRVNKLATALGSMSVPRVASALIERTCDQLAAGRWGLGMAGGSPARAQNVSSTRSSLAP